MEFCITVNLYILVAKEKEWWSERISDARIPNTCTILEREESYKNTFDIFFSKGSSCYVEMVIVLMEIFY